MGWEEHVADNFGYEKERNEPTPHEEAKVDIMPKGNKGEYGKVIENGA